jgi:hypothetical protein
MMLRQREKQRLYAYTTSGHDKKTWRQSLSTAVRLSALLRNLSDA